MSINVGQIFVKHENLSLVLRVITEHMRIWQSGVFSRLSDLEKEEQGAENFLSRRSRRLTVLPAKDGWMMIIEQVRFLADGDLAKHLSESLDCPVVWAEVQGGALGWACFELEKGKVVRARLEPVAGREARLVTAAVEAKGVSLSDAQGLDMPNYSVDPEMDAWNHLCSLGLPRDYIFVYPGDIVRLGSGGDIEAGFVILKDSYYGGRLITTTGPARFLPRPGGMPYRPDLVAREGGQPSAVHEVRLLQGRPTKAALDRAFAAELNWRRRAFYVMSATLSGRLPTVIFRYKDPANPEVDIDEMMSKYREASSSAFLKLTSSPDLLARNAFAAKAAEILNAASSGLEAKPDEKGNLVVQSDGEAAALDLSQAYRSYVLDPSAIERAATQALEAFQARSRLPGELTPADRDRLLPLVRDKADVASDAVAAPLGAGLSVVLGVERAGAVAELPRRALAALGIDETAALDAARARLAELAPSLRVSPGVEPCSRAETQAPLPASSLLAWSGLGGKLSELTGGQTVAAAPSRDVLLFAPASAATSGALRAAVAENYDTASDPVSDGLFGLTESGPVPA